MHISDAIWPILPSGTVNSNSFREPLAHRHDCLTRKALAKLDEIVTAPRTKGAPGHANIRRLRADVAKIILIVQIRADEAKLRSGQANNIQPILEVVLRRKAELAALEALDERRSGHCLLDLDDDEVDL
jgi:hypothetical protein